MVQQTCAVNTYVSRRSSLHGNPQHPNSCLLRSAAPEVGCFHGNQAAAFDDGSHETTPADNAGSSEPTRARMDGWLSGGGGFGAFFAGRNYAESEKIIASCRNGVTQRRHGSASRASSTWRERHGPDVARRLSATSGMASKWHRVFFLCCWLLGKRFKESPRATICSLIPLFKLHYCTRRLDTHATFPAPVWRQQSSRLFPLQLSVSAF